MCGIFGELRFHEAGVDRDALSRMGRSLAHRGPDGEGLHVAPGIGLGQRRLAVVDLDARSIGPLSNEDGTIWASLNGEIYNFRELRTELLQRNHCFRTEGDTEVLVHLYEEVGRECVHMLRGMFAFVIWDGNCRVLFGARDRLGKKPLFYASTRNSLLFASEVEAIVGRPEVSVSPNFGAIDLYLKYQYVPSPVTAFEGIRKLQAGHCLSCTSNGALSIEKYWSPLRRQDRPQNGRSSRKEIEEELRNRLEESVGLRLMADVPLGAFLSAGVDSTSIVALMATASEGPVKTFTIGTEGGAGDERAVARRTAARYQTEHHEFVVRAAATEVLPLLVRHYGEPFADSSALPTYYLSKLARQHVTVALSGDGGDETFGGYLSYQRVLRWQRLDFLPRGLRRACGGLLGTLGRRFGHSNAAARASRAATMLGSSLRERYVLQMSTFKPEERRCAYTPHFVSLIGGSAAQADGPATFAYEKGEDPLDWMMRHDQAFYLPDCLMVKTDVASMANGLEVRCPFLDHEFVEFAAGIPTAMKWDGGHGKAILRSAMAPMLPREVLDRPKSGLGVALADWFRGELADLLRGTLLDERAAQRNLFDVKFVRKLVDEQIDGRRDWSNRLWALLILELWFREFID